MEVRGRDERCPPPLPTATGVDLAEGMRGLGSPRFIKFLPFIKKIDFLKWPEKIYMST